MAFASRLGGLCRKSISQNGSMNGQVPMMSMLNAIRQMSSNLFIGGLSWGVDDESLRDAFTEFGEVVSARVIIDRETGRSRGFGFVNYVSDEAAGAALSSMDGKELDGRNIRVSYANDRPPAPRPYSNYGGGYNYGGPVSGGYGSNNRNDGNADVGSYGNYGSDNAGGGGGGGGGGESGERGGYGSGSY